MFHHPALEDDDDNPISVVWQNGFDTDVGYHVWVGVGRGQQGYYVRTETSPHNPTEAEYELYHPLDDPWYHLADSVTLEEAIVVAKSKLYDSFKSLQSDLLDNPLDSKEDQQWKLELYESRLEEVSRELWGPERTFER